MNLSSGGATPPQRQRFNRTSAILLFPLVIGLIVLVAFCYIFYNIGVDKGRTDANAERDAFYQNRINQQFATLTPAINGAGTPSPTGTPAPIPNTLARVDKVEGNRLTLVLLGANGLPSGSTLVLTLGQGSQVWKNVSGTPADVNPGDSIVFSGERNNADGSYDARSVVVLTTGR
jgi:hypothetical protein